MFAVDQSDRNTVRAMAWSNCLDYKDHSEITLESQLHWTKNYSTLAEMAKIIQHVNSMQLHLE